MQIKEKAAQFYYENEELIWKSIWYAGLFGYGLYLGYLFGATKYFDKGLKAGCDASEAFMAAMEPEAYARMCKNATAAVRILKK